MSRHFSIPPVTEKQTRNKKTRELGPERLRTLYSVHLPLYFLPRTTNYFQLTLLPHEQAQLYLRVTHHIKSYPSSIPSLQSLLGTRDTGNCSRSLLNSARSQEHDCIVDEDPAHTSKGRTDQDSVTQRRRLTEPHFTLTDRLGAQVEID
jgi:hypothetical protein